MMRAAGQLLTDKPGKLDRLVLIAALVALAALGAVSLAVKVWRLIADQGPQGAIDLKIIFNFTQQWFAGIPIYARPETAGVTHPPATFLLVWPAYGWTTLGEARVIWTAVSLVALVGVAFLGWRAMPHTNSPARFCVLLAPFSMPAMVDALGIGQLTIVALVASVSAVLLATQKRPRWTRDVSAAALFGISLVKPSITIPFFIPFLILPNRARPAVLAAAGYAVMTVVSSRWQTMSLPAQIRGWLRQARGNSGAGYGDVQDWLFQLGWQDAFPVLSLSLLVALCAFCWRSRHRDVWVTLGVSAIIARFWTYHRVYDDAILLIALVATARVAASPLLAPSLRAWAQWVVIAGAAVLWIPLQFHYVGSTFGPLTITPAWMHVFNATHTAAALLMLRVLWVCRDVALQAPAERRADVVASPVGP